MTILALIAAIALNLPLAAAVIGHRRDWRRQRDADEVAHIEAGLVIAASPLIRAPWPGPQSPRQLEAAYDDTPTVVSYPLHRYHWLHTTDLEPGLRYLVDQTQAPTLVHRPVQATPDYEPRHAALPEHDIEAVPVWSDWSATVEMARIRVEAFAS
jgi:hypothetical protein